MTKMEKCQAIVSARFSAMTRSQLTSYLNFYFNEVSNEKLEETYRKYCKETTQTNQPTAYLGYNAVATFTEGAFKGFNLYYDTDSKKHFIAIFASVTYLKNEFIESSALNYFPEEPKDIISRNKEMFLVLSSELQIDMTDGTYYDYYEVAGNLDATLANLNIAFPQSTVRSFYKVDGESNTFWFRVYHNNPNYQDYS